MCSTFNTKGRGGGQKLNRCIYLKAMLYFIKRARTPALLGC